MNGVRAGEASGRARGGADGRRGRLGGVSATGPSLLTAEVCAMRLEEFARAGLVVEVWSSVLEETVVFASDDARVDPARLVLVADRAHDVGGIPGVAAVEDAAQLLLVAQEAVPSAPYGGSKSKARVGWCPRLVRPAADMLRGCHSADQTG